MILLLLVPLVGDLNSPPGLVFCANRPGLPGVVWGTGKPSGVIAVGLGATALVLDSPPLVVVGVLKKLWTVRFEGFGDGDFQLFAERGFCMSNASPKLSFKSSASAG